MQEMNHWEDMPETMPEEPITVGIMPAMKISLIFIFEIN